MEEKENIFEEISDIGQAENIFNRYRTNNPNDQRGTERLLNDLMKAISNQKRLIGDADDFHNFAVSVAQTLNDNNASNYIVMRGLEIHPINTDLLADAIKYGYSCGEKDSCQKCFKKLVMIDKSRWSWRAFSFSIEYLLQEWISSTNCEYRMEDIISLSEEYKKHMPNEEDAWFSEYEIYAGTNQRQKSLEVLEEAIKKFKFCPRCWLRYASMMIDDGDFEKAEPILKKMRKNPKTREDVNISYMYFLEAQCQINAFYNSEAYENGEIDETVIWNIYKTFRLVLSSKGVRDNIISRIYEYINEIYAESDIEFPTEWKYKTSIQN